MDDPNWVPPLLMNERKRIGPVGPGSECGRQLWIARMGGRTVGRISAQLGHETEPRGHFGWIEAIDSDAVFDALFGAAEGWLVAHGARRCSGPFSFTINDESGLLVDGFDSAPMILMPHGRPYYARQLERLGYRKEMDLFAYRIDTRTPLPRAVEKILRLVSDDPRITLRQMRRERFEDEIRTVLDLFNDAWSGNWGFEPFTEAHIAEMAKDLKPLLPSPAFSVAEYDGRPVAFALGLGLGMSQPMVLSLIHTAAPAGRAGEAVGVRATLVNFSQTAMPLMFGVLGATLGMAPVFLSMAMLLAGGSWYVRRTRVREGQPS